MGYIKTLDDRKLINHKFIVAFKVEPKQVFVNPWRLYADTSDGMSRVLGDYPTQEAALTEAERLIKEMYVNKSLIVEVK